VVPSQTATLSLQAGKDVYAREFVECNSFEEQAEAIIREHSLCRKIDDSRPRARRHIKKLLETGQYNAYQLLTATRRYGAMMKPVWAEEFYDVDYRRGSAAREDKYVRSVGNFFGREAEYKDYVGRGYKADIDEDDWKWFTTYLAPLCVADLTILNPEVTKTRKELKAMWCSNFRLVQRYGYTPEQFCLPYDRRFEVC